MSTLIRLCAVATIAVAGCGGAARTDKSGAPVKQTVTLKLQMPDASDAIGKRFAAEVTRRSHGSVRVEIDRAAPYDSRDPAAEVRLARALEAGTEDIGYLPARAWAADGRTAFSALQAPFVVTTYPAAQAVATSPIAKQVLDTLPSSVVGVALVPTQLRRVLAVRPPVSMSALAGLRVRIIDNAQSAADFRALGAQPVQGLDSGEVATEIQARRLDGAETSTSIVLEDSYAAVAKYLSSYAVFPKFQSIVLSSRAWARLSAEQRDAVRDAARSAVTLAGELLPRQEQTQLAQLCRSGLRVVAPSEAQLSALATAGAAADNAADPQLVAALRALPGAGPQAMVSPLPHDCTVPAPAAPAPHATRVKFPEGVYVTTDTVKDWQQGDVINPDFTTDITFRTRLKDGRWYQTQKPSYADQCPCSGTYKVNGDQIRFVMTDAGGAVVLPETVTWSYFNRQLRFTLVDVADNGSKVIYTAHPWRKVG
jgi:TRAP-type C4-dicarboxylate transport system substrate-binding protein